MSNNNGVYLIRIITSTDDELPDYVMVMVANKRTRSQMDDDLQLFLGDNTELFVNWLHQVLKKLQEVTVAAPASMFIECLFITGLKKSLEVYYL